MRQIFCTMSGVGKTTLTKQTNKQYSIQDRPVIELDYRAPRNITTAVKEAQSCLIDAWFASGAKAAFTYYSSLDFRVLDANDKIVFILPNDWIRLGYIVLDVLQRDGKCQFAKEYAENGARWMQDALRAVIQCIRDRGSACIRWLRKTEYLSDALIWTGDQFSCAVRYYDESDIPLLENMIESYNDLSYTALIES